MRSGGIGRWSRFCGDTREARWQVEDLIAAFAEFLLTIFANGRFIADVTHTTTQGKKQAARSFRKNPHYRKGYENQSTFLAGNDVLALAFLADGTQENKRIQRYCFALGGVLLRLSNKKRREKQSLVRAIERIVPKGQIVLYDRGGNDAKTINCLSENYTYITRLNANAVFYSDPQCKHKLDIKHEPDVVQKRKRENVYRTHHICLPQRGQETRLGCCRVVLPSSKTALACGVLPLYQHRYAA
jgi:hypothetical protein